MNDLASFAAHLGRMATDLPNTERRAMEIACEAVRDEAKRVIGTYDYGWPALKPATIARKSSGDTPLLETGELRDSIVYAVFQNRSSGGQFASGHTGYVRSTSKKAEWHELGTKRIPPRSFLGAAARHKESAIVDSTGRLFASALAGQSEATSGFATVGLTKVGR